MEMIQLLIKMILIWIFVFILGNILYVFLKNNRMFLKITQWIYNHRKKISIFLVGLIIVGVYVLLFSVRGSETVYLTIGIRDKIYTELRCADIVYEYYDEKHPLNGYIEFRVHLKIEEKNREDYEIRFYVKRNREYFYESFEKSYIEEWFSSEKLLPEKISPSRSGYDACKSYYYYYFDISIPPKYDEVHFTMYIYVGDDLLSLNKERITLKRTINDINFGENTNIISYFGNDWNIVHDKEIKDSKAVPNIIESKRDVHQLTTIVRGSTDKSVTQEIKLERNLALFYTKIGVFLGALLAGISSVVTVCLYRNRRRDGETNRENAMREMDLENEKNDWVYPISIIAILAVLYYLSYNSGRIDFSTFLNLVLITALVVFTAYYTKIIKDQHILMRRATELPIFIDLFKEFRSLKFKSHLKYIHKELDKKCDPIKGYMGLPKSAEKHVLPVSQFFETLGQLVAHNIIDEDLVTSYMGGSIRNVWKVLGKYIYNERKIREKKGIGEEYQEFFEDLVVRIGEKPPAEIIKRLKLRKVERTKTKEEIM